MNDFEKREEIIESYYNRSKEKAQKYLKLMENEESKKRFGWKIRFKIYSSCVNGFLNQMKYWDNQLKKLNNEKKEENKRLMKEIMELKELAE